MEYKINESNKNDIVRFFDITDGVLNSGNRYLEQFLKKLEKNNILYQVQSEGSIVMVVAYNYLEKMAK